MSAKSRGEIMHEISQSVQMFFPGDHIPAQLA